MPRFIVREHGPRDFYVHDTVSHLSYDPRFTRKGAQAAADRRNEAHAMQQPALADAMPHRRTGVTLRWLDQNDRTPRHIHPDDMGEDLVRRHRNARQIDAHTRVFTDRDGNTVTVRWTVDGSGNGHVVQVFEDTRGGGTPDPKLI